MNIGLTCLKILRQLSFFIQACINLIQHGAVVFGIHHIQVMINVLLIRKILWILNVINAQTIQKLCVKLCFNSQSIFRLVFG